MSNLSSNYKSEYFGKEGISTSNLEIIQSWKLNQNGKNLVVNKFNFIAKQDCTIIINDSDPIPFKANKEFIMDIGMNPIHRVISEFKIVEENINYWYMGIFKD